MKFLEKKQRRSSIYVFRGQPNFTRSLSQLGSGQLTLERAVLFQVHEALHDDEHVVYADTCNTQGDYLRRNPPKVCIRQKCLC